MASELIERMAIALFTHDGRTAWLDVCEELRGPWLAAAHAALLAIREPTHEMLLACCAVAKAEQVRPIEVHLADAGVFWRAMIDAASNIS